MTEGNSGNNGDNKKTAGPASTEPIITTTSTSTATPTRASTTKAPAETKEKRATITTRALKRDNKMTIEEGLLFNDER